VAGRTAAMGQDRPRCPPGGQNGAAESGMTRGAAFRGQPLLALCTLLLGWAMVRAFLWESPLSAGAIAERVAVRSRSGVTGMGENRALPASKFALVSSRMGPGSAEPFLLLATGSTSLLPASLVDVFGTTTTTSVDSIVERPARLLSPEAGSADAVAADGGGRAPTMAAPMLVEIGRASCRERVEGAEVGVAR